MASKGFFSKKIKHLVDSFDKLPEAIKPLLMTRARLEATRMVKRFKEGIRTNAFHLVKLSKGAVQRKQALGYKLPHIPLYGRGDEEKERSYINMLRLQKLKNGWRVIPSSRKHWSGKLKLKDLHRIHEFGTLIKRGDTIIRIPPRPAVFRAYEAQLKELKSRSKDKTIQRDIQKAITSGKKELKLKISEREQAFLVKYGIAEEV